MCIFFRQEFLTEHEEDISSSPVVDLKVPVPYKTEEKFYNICTGTCTGVTSIYGTGTVQEYYRKVVGTHARTACTVQQTLSKILAQIQHSFVI